jgi:hypothetical protein
LVFDRIGRKWRKTAFGSPKGEHSESINGINRKEQKGTAVPFFRTRVPSSAPPREPLYNFRQDGQDLQESFRKAIR